MGKIRDAAVNYRNTLVPCIHRDDFDIELAFLAGVKFHAREVLKLQCGPNPPKREFTEAPVVKPFLIGQKLVRGRCYMVIDYREDGGQRRYGEFVDILPSDGATLVMHEQYNADDDILSFFVCERDDIKGIVEQGESSAEMGICREAPRTGQAPEMTPVGVFSGFDHAQRAAAIASRTPAMPLVEVPRGYSAHDVERYNAWRAARNTGGNVNYYLVEIDKPKRAEFAPYTAECEDIIEALDMEFAAGCAFKAIWRRAAAKKSGVKKANYDGAIYDAEKIVYYGQRMVAADQAGDI